MAAFPEGCVDMFGVYAAAVEIRDCVSKADPIILPAATAPSG